MKKAAKEPLLVQLGCGPGAKPTHWEDYDGSWNAWINCLPGPIRGILRKIYGASGRTAAVFPEHVFYLNLHRTLPFASGSVDAIYASHVWEHLYYEDARRATNECFRVLKRGAYLRLVVPDLQLYCEQYLGRLNDPAAAKALHGKLLYRHLAREKSLLIRLYTAVVDFHTHKFMYDEAAMMEMLRESGFSEIRRCAYLESSIGHLGEVESETRVSGGMGMAIEARKI
jgi:SAM-dependent methyltransferase